MKQNLSDLQLEMASKHSKEMEEMRMKLLAFNFGDEKENLESLRRDMNNIGRNSIATEPNPLFISTHNSARRIFMKAQMRKRKE